jgi:hypothetical protein
LWAVRGPASDVLLDLDVLLALGGLADPSRRGSQIQIGTSWVSFRILRNGWVCPGLIASAVARPGNRLL